MSEDFSFPRYASYAKKCGDKSIFTKEDYFRWIRKSYDTKKELMNLLYQEFEKGKNGDDVANDQKLRNCAKNIVREFQSLYFDFLLNENSEMFNYAMYARNEFDPNSPLEELFIFCNEVVFPTEFQGTDNELGKIVDYENRIKLKVELSKVKLNSSSPKANIQYAD